jgi:hypothetical protein
MGRVADRLPATLAIGSPQNLRERRERNLRCPAGSRAQAIPAPESPSAAVRLSMGAEILGEASAVTSLPTPATAAIASASACAMVEWLDSLS